MIDRIKTILGNMDSIDGWLINKKDIESSELFFVKKELDMNRRKNVSHINVTVYKDFEENGVKFKGSSTTKVSPNMDDKEIKDALTVAALAASFVKNEHYSLVTPSNEIPEKVESKFSEDDLSVWLPGLIDGIYSVDNEENGRINSSEIFINKINNRIINSKAVDVSFTTYSGEIEVITEWKEDKEEVELFKIINFSDYKPEELTEIVKTMLLNSKERALALPMPKLKDIPVLFNGESVKTLFNYYFNKSAGQLIYEGVSDLKIGDLIQGEKVDGDLINIKLAPVLENSNASLPYDSDGYLLKEVVLFEDGVLKNYHASKRYADYLNIPTTGYIGNIIVGGGSKTTDEFKENPYLELLAFSDFQIDPFTGDFGGEVRLGRYFDGEKITPITGGSIAGNIKDVHQNMYLSKELQQDNNFVGPETVQIFNVSIAGIGE